MTQMMATRTPRVDPKRCYDENDKCNPRQMSAVPPPLPLGAPPQ